MFLTERDQLRQVFFASFRKHKANRVLEPLEAQVLTIILMHPEYHLYLEAPDAFQTKDFSEHNPFLHMSLHVSVREQISTNRPQGIAAIYEKLCTRMGDAHLAEHLMLDCLAEILWESQSQRSQPDEKIYLNKLQRL
jgi:hypothetical protein